MELKDQTPETIRQWNDQHHTAAAALVSGTNSKRGKRARRRRASPDVPSFITGKDFDPAQAALNEVPW